MSGFRSRGACPSLSEPMQTGDGLLARLVLDRTDLTLVQLGSVLWAAERHGNGIVEVTSRGNLQIRGLTAPSADALGGDIAPLNLSFGGLPVSTGVLAGIDSQEIANPLPLADAIRRALSPELRSRLAPKTSIVIDGGGQLPIDGIAADIRLAAAGGTREWLVSVGGNAVSARPVCRIGEADVVPVVIELLERMASIGKLARGRDLQDEDLSQLGPTFTTVQPASIRRRVPVGAFGLVSGSNAVGVGLSFGSASATALAELVATAGKSGASAVRLAPGRAVMFIGLDRIGARELITAAEALGFVTRPDDPRLAISACMGAPGCASGEFDTKKLATEICAAATPLLDGSFMLHVSGCAKRCADVAGPKLTILGGNDGFQILPESELSELPMTVGQAEKLPELLGSTAARFCRERRIGETAKSFLLRRWMQSSAAELTGPH